MRYWAGAATKIGHTKVDHNRIGSFAGSMAASFQVDPPQAPPKGDLETAEAYGRRVSGITLQFVPGMQA